MIASNDRLGVFLPDNAGERLIMKPLFRDEQVYE